MSWRLCSICKWQNIIHNNIKWELSKNHNAHFYNGHKKIETTSIVKSFSKTIEMESPITPKEFIGQEPCLDGLIEDTNNNSHLYEDINKDCLKKKHINWSYKNPTHSFYLGGQLSMNTIDRITESNINKAKELIKKKNKEYGEPANSYEAASIKNAAEDFENIQKIIKRYYEIQLHELYRPPNPDITNDLGGKEYQKIEKTTRIGKTA